MLCDLESCFVAGNVIAMETQRMRLLEKFNLSIENLNYSFIDQCDDRKTLEKVVRVLRSGEEGSYPHLLKYAEEKLCAVMPSSRLLNNTRSVLKNVSLGHNCRKEFLDELKQFTTEMKMQEENVLCSAAKMPSYPAVRAMELKTVGESKVEPCQTRKRTVPRNYSEWDKFDVDKELKKMEIEEEREKEVAVMRSKESNVKKHMAEEVKTSSQENILCDMSEQERWYVETQEKQKGNECFRAGEYAEAVCHYTKCLQLRESVDVYNNRAMAYLKLDQWSEAVKDCNHVLEMEPNNAKAYYRRSSAYQKLLNFSQARDDMAQVIELQPDLQIAKKVHSMLEKQCASQKCYRMPITDVSEDVGYLGKNAELRMDKYLDHNTCRNIIVGNAKKVNNRNKKEVVPSHPKIVELPDVGNKLTCETSYMKSTHIENAVAERIVAGIQKKRGAVDDCYKMPSCKNENKCAASSDSAEVESKNNALNVQFTPKQTGMSGVITKQSKELYQSSKKCDVCVMEGRSPSYMCQWLCSPPKTPAKYREIKSDNFNENHVRRVTITLGKDGAGTTNVPREPTAGKMDVEHLCTNNAVVMEEDRNGNRVVNTTSPYNFLKLWQVLRDGNSNLVYHAHLLKNLNPSELPNVLGNKLDGEMLGTFLKCFDQHFDVENNGHLVANYLDNLSRAERFQTVSLLLDAGEREVVHRLLCRLKNVDVVPRRFESAFLPQ